MTKYKKLVKKNSLRYNNCKTHRRKGRRAGAGGTLRHRIGNLLRTRRTRTQDAQELRHHTALTPQDDALRTFIFHWRSEDALNTAIHMGVDGCDNLLNQIKTERIFQENTLKELLISRPGEKYVDLLIDHKNLVVELEDIASKINDEIKHSVDIKTFIKKKQVKKSIHEYTALVKNIKTVAEKIIETLDLIDEDIGSPPSYGDVVGRSYGSSYDDDDDED